MLEIIRIHQTKILDIGIENLRISFDSTQVFNKETFDTHMNLETMLERIYIKDCQKEQHKDKKASQGLNEPKIRSVIPKCYQMILSNPDKEGTREDDIKISNRRVYKRRDVKQFLLNAKIKNKDFDVNFELNSLRLVITIPTLEKITNFLERVKIVQLKYQVESKKKEKIDDDALESENEKEKEPFSKLKNEKNQGKELGVIKSIYKERENYLMRGKALKTREERFTTAINATGVIKSLTIWFPLDPTDENSRVMSLSFSSHLSFRQAAVTMYSINDSTQTVLEELVVKESQDAMILINNLIIYMLNRHLIVATGRLSDERLLQPSRLCLVYDNLYKSQEHNTITNIDVTIEPLDLEIGFREIENLTKIQVIIDQLINDINKAMDPIPLNYLQNEEGNRIATTYDLDNIDKINQKKLEELENAIGLKPLPMRERKYKEFIKTIIKVKVDSVLISLIDDIGKHEYSLVNFQISNMFAKIEQETGLDDAATFILKKLGCSNDPFMKGKAMIELNSNYYNIDSGAYEPLIEPWSLSANVFQKTEKSPMKVNLESRKMLNINLTYGMALGSNLSFDLF